jgi:two-component system chemotaxis response regulator CheB
MPNMDGFTFLRWLMSASPTPVIVVSSTEANEDVFRALDLGALDFVLKPSRHPSPELEQIKNDLIEKVLAVPLLQQKGTREKMQLEAIQTRVSVAKSVPSERPRLIGIGASTGGPQAIAAILRELPGDFEVPILIAQHMPSTFTKLFAQRLNLKTAFPVKEAEDGEVLTTCAAYVAPGDAHMIVRSIDDQFRIEIQRSNTDLRYHPSADLLFGSMAAVAGSRTIGIVLTGMGNDGKQGLQEIKKNGGIAIAESKKTAVIFGMPEEAIRAGAIDHVLPLQEIPFALKTLCRYGHKE